LRPVRCGAILGGRKCLSKRFLPLVVRMYKLARFRKMCATLCPFRWPEPIATRSPQTEVIYANGRGFGQSGREWAPLLWRMIEPNPPDVSHAKERVFRRTGVST
jgi:hypothetical protein